jgi:hypothetical protein
MLHCGKKVPPAGGAWAQHRDMPVAFLDAKTLAPGPLLGFNLNKFP